jgi:2-dehydropantoate 2-reductase
MGGLCRISTYIAGPGHICHVGIVPSVAFGELDGRASQRVENLRQAFERAGVTVSIPEDIRAAIWEKFIFIASVSGVGAVARCPAGVSRSLPATRSLLEGAIEEIVNTARAQQIALPQDIVSKTMSLIDSLSPGVIPSMQRDIQDGKSSELEAQNGAVMRLGMESGVPTPIHTFIYQSLLPQELKARGEILF